MGNVVGGVLLAGNGWWQGREERTISMFSQDRCEGQACVAFHRILFGGSGIA